MYSFLMRPANISGLVCVFILSACGDFKANMEKSSSSLTSSLPGDETSEVPPGPGPGPAPTPLPIPAPGAGPQCGMQTNTAAVAYCDTFDKAFPIVGGSGQMDQRLWGVSRGGLQLNINSPWAWANATSNVCGGIATTTALTDIQVCNGRMYETTNDHLYGIGEVVNMTMYPKQPFDFSGRTGTVAFDVTNDTAGTHAAWPEFWITDQAFPLPITHFEPFTAPANGFGLRFSGACPPGQSCDGCPAEDYWRTGVDSVAVSRDWFVEEVGGPGCDFGDDRPTCVNTGMTFKVLGCVKQSTGPTGGLNHFEIKVSQNRIDVYGTDAGTTTPLKHIAVVEKANLSFSRGFIWIQDKHYNADKGDERKPKQIIHTFGWDNIAFDGPLVARDLAFEVPPAMVAVNGGYYLGWSTQPGQAPTLKTLPVGAADIVAAKTVTLLFTFYSYEAPAAFTYKINGHVHQSAWPFPDKTKYTRRTIALPVPVTDLVMGQNEIQIYSQEYMEIGNVSLSLNGAAGIVKP